MQSLYYPPEVGGLESHVRTLAEGLAARGHRVTMLTSRSRPGLARAENVGGVEIRRCWMPARTPAGWIAHVAATLPGHLRRAHDANIFHAQTFASVPPAMLSRSVQRRPLVVTLHTSHFLMLAGRAAWRPILRRIVRAADHLLSTSREIQKVAHELYPHPRSEVLTNAVDTARFRPLDDRAGAGPRDQPRNGPRILVPRRLYPKNGVEYIVRALPAVAREVEGLEVWVVGDGPERERLERLARELGAAERLRFLGARPHDEMPRLLAGADLVVIPSLMEATSVAGLEAMACGVPVAASRVGGLPDIVDDRVGALFRPADPDDLAAKVIGLLLRPDLRELGRTARERVVERWSIDRLVEHHERIYSQLVV